jgi:hypothetical protein
MSQMWRGVILNCTIKKKLCAWSKYAYRRLLDEVVFLHKHFAQRTTKYCSGCKWYVSLRESIINFLNIKQYLLEEIMVRWVARSCCVGDAYRCCVLNGIVSTVVLQYTCFRCTHFKSTPQPHNNTSTTST